MDIEIVIHPVHQAVVGDENVHTRQRLVLGAVLARHRELMLALDDRGAVMNDGVELAADHLGIEVGDLRTLGTVGGAELLEHALEGHTLAGDDGEVIVVLLLEHPAVLFARLTLTQHEEAVVLTADVEGRTAHHAAAHAQTVGQQLYRGNVVVDVVNQLIGRGEEVGHEGLVFIWYEPVFLNQLLHVSADAGQVVVQGHHQDGVAFLVGGGHVAFADVPAAFNGAVIHLTLAGAVGFVGGVGGTRQTGVAVHFLQQGHDLVGVGGLLGDGIGVACAACISPLIGDRIIVRLGMHGRLAIGCHHASSQTQGSNNEP